MKHVCELFHKIDVWVKGYIQFLTQNYTGKSPVGFMGRSSFPTYKISAVDEFKNVYGKI